MLNRMFGKWPIDGFRMLSPQQQRDFWASTTSSLASLKKMVEDTVVSKMIDEELSKLEGPFLPLSVWASQGYDTKLIEQTAAKEEHEILGTTYQVRIHTTSASRRREMVQAQMLKLLAKPKDTIEQGAAVEEDEDGQEIAKSSSDTSSTSSSSSDKKSKKKRKKHKKKHSKKSKDKKDKKGSKEVDVRRAQAAAEKAERNRVAKVKSDSGKILAKVSPQLLQLEEMQRDEHFAKIPAVLKTKVKESVSTLRGFNDEATSKLKIKDPLDLTFGIEEVIAAAKEAGGIIKIMTSMLSTVGKL
jgi:hypothetical protein